MRVWETEEVIEILEQGPVRLKLKFTNGELRQFTRDMGTADTCHCDEGHKSCGFISELEWTDRLLWWDKDGRIAVWDIGTHEFTNILAEDIDVIIGHGEDEGKPSCCCSKEN